MAERALRGTRLGATSYENDRNTDLAPRQEVAFDCPKGHRFTVPFAAEAEIPVNWECRICGATSPSAHFYDVHRLCVRTGPATGRWLCN